MIQYAIFMHSKADISQLNGTENKKQKMKEERQKTKTDVLKKRSGQESVESVLKLRGKESTVRRICERGRF